MSVPVGPPVRWLFCFLQNTSVIWTRPVVKLQLNQHQSHSPGQWGQCWAVTQLLLGAQTPQGSSDKPKSTGKPRSHILWPHRPQRWRWKPVLWLPEQPGALTWALGELWGSWGSTRRGQILGCVTASSGTVSSVTGKTWSLRTPFSCSPLCSLLSPLFVSGPWFMILSPSAAAILLLWELCRGEE